MKWVISSHSTKLFGVTRSAILPTMKRWLSHRSLFLYLAAGLVAVAVTLLAGVFGGPPTPRVTTTVEEGTVRQLVSITGAIRAENTAALGFPTAGTIKTVHVRKGDAVATGTPLITLDTESLRAEVLEAQAALRSARADLAERQAGVRPETRAVAEETIRLKTTALERTTADQLQNIESARRTLLSSDLAAVTKNPSEDAVPPIISGTYACDTEGTYTLTVYRSGSQSGYSIRIDGLEQGTYPASFDQALPIGSCGLRVRLTAGNSYHDSVWAVEIPNTKSSRYTENYNTYTSARTSAESAIAIAEQELSAATVDATLTTAGARTEEIERARAAVASAEARLIRAEANAKDAVLVAPFAGTVTAVEATAGEAVTAAPIVTLLSADRYELIARVPEIDVGKLRLGQKAEVVFDTSAGDTLTATVDFISPDATVIDGVSYFEARLALDTLPPWIRSGLNADIDIIVAEATGPRLPRRFVSQSGTEFFVTTRTGEYETATTTISVDLVGNDGFVAVRDLPVGTTVVAP
jgi:HlyD family secretion protein